MNEHDAIARIKRLSHSINCADEIAEVIERLIKERDEARWEVCGFHHLTGFLAGDYAISRGWNYLNDERKWSEFRPSVKEFDEFLKAQSQLNIETIDRLTKECNEARREACYLAAELDMLNHVSATAESIALEYNWDCFKEEADHNNNYFKTHHK